MNREERGRALEKAKLQRLEPRANFGLGLLQSWIGTPKNLCLGFYLAPEIVTKTIRGDNAGKNIWQFFSCDERWVDTGGVFFATNAPARNGMHLEHVLESIEVVSSSRVLAVTQSLMDIDAKK